jgi:BirA family biotin operon repressor/biotin-[acetyl-CoA-carboxylase] ligase
MRGLSSADDLGIDPGLHIDPDRALNGIAELGLSTRYVGARLHYLESVGSTNTALADLAGRAAPIGDGSSFSDGEPPGTVVISDEQTAGKGRSGRSWFSPPGRGIWASVLVRTDMPPDRLAPLSIAGAVSVAEALHELTGPEIRMKWPNDLLVDGRKLGGLLVEAVRSSHGNVLTAVVGIGLNVNLARDELPVELAGTATSLRIELGREVSRLQTLRAVLQALEGCFDTFLRLGMAPFVDSWRNVSTLLGRSVVIEMPGRSVDGTVVDMAPSGALIVELASGETQEIWQGDVRFRPAGQ